MNKNKNQAIIVIISLALSIIPIVSPLAVYAEETTQGQDTQQTTYTGDVSESVVISNSDGEKDIEKQEDINISSVKEDDKHLQISKYNILDEIVAGFDSYVFSNDTTEQDVEDYFKQILDENNVKYDAFHIDYFNKIDAKEYEDGEISFEYRFEKETGFTKAPYRVLLPSLSRNDNIELSEATFEDRIFREFITNTYDLDNNGYLSLWELTKINKIDVSSLGDIGSLKGIEYLSWLKFLDCSNLEKVTALDISRNVYLETLDCSRTGITAIDVSQNHSLTGLRFENTGITTLDVSNNPNLRSLRFDNTPLMSLNVGEKANYEINLHGLSSNLNSNFLTNTFNIKDMDKNIDLNKITMGNNGTLDKTTGIISGYSMDQPIEYSYFCGKNVDDDPVMLNVKIELAIEINEKNFPDHLFRQYISNKIDSAYTNDGRFSASEISKIDKIDLSDSLYKDIKNLEGIEHFTSLEELQCQNTEIKSLNLSKNYNLKKLVCDNTGITSLDLSNNHLLSELSCAGTPLAWLTLGQGSLQNYNLPQPQFNVQVNSSEFDITKVFDGINPNNVTMISGAKMKAGIVSEYKVGTPIVYEFYCGEDQSGFDVLLQVELNLTKSDRTLEFTEDLSVPKLYTGKVIDDPKTNIEGAIFTYEIWNGTVWESLKNDKPINVGTYRVTALLPDDGYNNDVTASSEFTITKADNEFTTPLAIENWTYGEQANKPVALAKYGTVKYTYSDSRNSIYTDQEPREAGTYYVKATVEDTANYKGLESIKEFMISKADNEFTTPLAIENWTYGEQANKPVALAKYGTVKYTYSDSKTGIYTDQVPRNAGTYYVKATVEDTINYKGLESICSFVILPIDKENNKHITISDMDESGDVNNLVIKDGDTILEKGVDYDVEIKHDGSEVNVIIVFKGNYTGMIIKSYKVNADESDDKPIEVHEDAIKEQSKEDTKKDIKDAPKTDVIKDTGNVTVTGFLGAWSVIISGCAYLFHGMKKDKKAVK